jgi:hypothetical protein
VRRHSAQDPQTSSTSALSPCEYSYSQSPLSYTTNFFNQNSVYSLFPYFTPKKMKEALTEQKRSSHYVFDRPLPPSPVRVVDTREGILGISGTAPAAPTSAEAVALNGPSANGDNTALSTSPLSRLWRRSSARSSMGPERSGDNSWASDLRFLLVGTC